MWTSSGLRENWKTASYIGSSRFYAHAQNLWGTVKGWWHYLNLGGSWNDLIEVLESSCPTACAYIFKLRPGVLSKTLSPMWGKLNLPMFLSNVGLLTPIKIDYLIFLAKPCPSLPIIWKLFWLVGWPVWLLWWWMVRGPSPTCGIGSYLTHLVLI